MDAAIEKAQSDLTRVAKIALSEIDTRFPPVDVLRALSMVHPKYWLNGDNANFDADLKCIIETYGAEVVMPNGTNVAAKLSSAALQREGEWFRSTMICTTEQLVEEYATSDVSQNQTRANNLTKQLARAGVEVIDDDDEDGESDDGEFGDQDCSDDERERGYYDAQDKLPQNAVVLLWRRICSNPVNRKRLASYVQLAELALVLPLGSVPEERSFSTLNMVKSKTRNRLSNHLNCAMRLRSQTFYDLGSFPYKKAIDRWYDTVVRCRYGV